MYNGHTPRFIYPSLPPAFSIGEVSFFFFSKREQKKKLGQWMTNDVLLIHPPFYFIFLLRIQRSCCSAINESQMTDEINQRIIRLSNERLRVILYTFSFVTLNVFSINPFNSGQTRLL